MATFGLPNSVSPSLRLGEASDNWHYCQYLEFDRPGWRFALPSYRQSSPFFTQRNAYYTGVVPGLDCLSGPYGYALHSSQSVRFPIETQLPIIYGQHNCQESSLWLWSRNKEKLHDSIEPVTASSWTNSEVCPHNGSRPPDHGATVPGRANYEPSPYNFRRPWHLNRYGHQRIYDIRRSSHQGACDSTSCGATGGLWHHPEYG